MERLLDIENLKTYFHTEDGIVPAVDGVSFGLDKGETLGVVGESGCGKSVTSLSVMRLIPTPPGEFRGGRILFRGEDLLKKSEAELRRIRGNEISMIFQEPMTSLNPVFTIGDQIAEAIQLHQGKSRKEAMERAAEMLRLVGIPAPEKRIHEYPHQLSGGMRQRAMIAMALSCEPALLIADEPTTALDVTIQAQILELMKKLKRELGMAIMLITHDLGVVAEMCERVVVMYAGKVVEEADVVSLFQKPLHPYTEGLLKSIPRLDTARGGVAATGAAISAAGVEQASRGGRERLHVIEGVVPNPQRLPSGCRFHPRCPYAQEVCRTQEPPLLEAGPGRQVACWLHNEIPLQGVAS
ncbi:MAG: ABC transporter ATP-binding protein [Firmicutes bacterium]|nr:ABC transporter ATP-binding protein [Bacillota bacterium]